MRRITRHLFTLAAATSLLLCVATCILWFQGRTTYNNIAWSYDRYLPDKSAASDSIILTSNTRLWLDISWGEVGPYNGHLVYGYYVNAENSGGHQTLRLYHELYDRMPSFGFKQDFDAGTQGIGPIRWYTGSRHRPKDGDDERTIHLGISHWLAALLLPMMPTLWLNRFRKERRASKKGLCKKCGYDLRASPDRCPECGTPVLAGLKIDRCGQKWPSTNRTNRHE